MNPDIKQILFSENDLKECVGKLGKLITEDYKGKNLLLVSILKGSVCFMTDLMREIDLPCQIDFMATSSYGAGIKTTGNVRLLKDLSIDITDYDVLIVEDILDSGKTLSYLIKLLKTRNPKSIKICALFDKPSRREVDWVVADYFGFISPDEFIVGYGLDYDEKYRNLPYVGILKDEVWNKVNKEVLS